ncbi:hypothetical protein Q8A67_024823 [Cirrhinus molitorella]|uniref:Ig-like domain-containing protein n=1 Tax=Cirrhinus molitorella TaxID=172907 RepID=A0AA88P526_9TELE|nr:hypothetical protein Q8A67_024823 [Cirrhinus molitorella]
MDMRPLLILSVLLALIKEDGGQNPEVTLLPKFPQVYVGDDITLVCNHKGGNKQTTWHINGSPQPIQNYSMLLTAVTTQNNGEYKCDQGGSTSGPYNLTVLELEPHAQLSPSIGGAVMTKGDGRNLVLQVDDDPKDWACFVLRGVRGFALGVDVDEKIKRASIFAELKEAERATFWCKKKKTEHRSNAVTLKMTELKVMLDPPAVPALQGEPVALRCVVWGGPKLENAIFYKDTTKIKSSPEGTYTITHATQNDNGNYSCRATYRYSHISAQAAQQEGYSDAQELKVIGGPPATNISGSANNLECSCSHCPAGCTSYLWYHTPFNDPYARRSLPKIGESITVEEEGLYSCRKDCGQGFSRFSDVYSYKEPGTVNVMPILIAAILIILGVLIVVLIALKRRRGESSIQAAKRDKDTTTGGDYEQIHLKDKDTAVYHTLGESTGKDQAEGGYEPLKKRQDEGVYHTLGPGEGKSQGEGQGEGQGGYEALKSVKAEVYQTLSSDDSKKTEGEAEGGYEKLPLKDKDYETVTVEENPYEEVKKQMGKEKE